MLWTWDLSSVLWLRTMRLWGGIGEWGWDWGRGGGRPQYPPPQAPICKAWGGRNVVFRVSCVGWEGGRRAMWCFRVGGTHKDEGCLLTLSPPTPIPLSFCLRCLRRKRKETDLGRGGGGGNGSGIPPFDPSDPIGFWERPASPYGMCCPPPAWRPPMMSHCWIARSRAPG